MRHFIAILFALACVAQVRDNNPRLLAPSTFANLGTPGNGSLLYCSDCTSGSPCAGSGSGAVARRENGAWNCGGPGGDFSSNTASSVDGEVLLFSGTGGKTGKRATLSASVVKSTSGVQSAAAYSDVISLWSGCTGTKVPSADGTCITASGSSSSIFQFVAQDRQDHISRCNLEIAESGTAVSLCSYPTDDDSYYSTYVMFVPASYTSGTVTAVVQWAHASGTDASKTFKFDLYLACKMAAFGSANTLTVNDTTATDHSIITATALDLTNTSGTCAAGDLARLKITRQPNANFTSTVGHWIAGVKVTWP